MPVPHAALWRDAGAREEDAGRAGILGRLLRGEPLWVIVPARGLEAPLPTPAAFRRQVLTLGAGDSVDREALVEHLQAAGYERVETVTGVGQWALRGGIVDVFSPAGVAAGPRRAGRGRRRVAPDLRSHHPALDGGGRDAPRPADAGRRGRGGGPARGLPAGRRAGGGRGSGAPRARRAGGRRRSRRSGRGRASTAACSLTDAPGRVPARDPLDRGRARPAPPARAGASAPGGPRASGCGSSRPIRRPRTASRRSSGISSTRCPSSRPCSARSRSPSWWRAPTSGSSARRSAWSVSRRPSSSGTAGRCAGGRPTSAAPRSPRSPTSRRATWSSTSSTGSAGTRGS